MDRSRPRHKIRRQVVEFEFPASVDRDQFQQRIAALFRERLKPIIEEILSELSPSGQINRIASLELNLGEIPLKKLESLSEERVRVILREELGRRIPKQSENEWLVTQQGHAGEDQMYQAVSGVTHSILEQQGLAMSQPENVHLSDQGAAKSAWEALNHFMEWGLLPWWAELTRLESLDDCLIQVIQSSDAFIETRLLRWVADPIIHKRLISQFTDEALRNLVSHLLSSGKEKGQFEAQAVRVSPSLSDVNNRMWWWSTVFKIMTNDVRERASISGFFGAIAQIPKNELFKQSSGRWNSLVSVWNDEKGNFRTGLKEGQEGGEPPNAREQDKGEEEPKREKLHDLRPAPEQEGESSINTSNESSVVGNNADPSDENRKDHDRLPNNLDKDYESKRDSDVAKNGPDSPPVDPSIELVSSRERDYSQEPRRSSNKGDIDQEGVESSNNEIHQGKKETHKEGAETESVKQSSPKQKLGDADQSSPMPAKANGTDRSSPPTLHNRPSVRKKLGEEESVYLMNSGLVILWPFFSRFFDQAGLVKESQFVDLEAQHKAAYLLQALATGQPQTPEYLLPLNKLLCGLPLFDPIMEAEPMDEEQLALAEELVMAVVQQVPLLNNMSADGFRGNFILRDGVLKRKNRQWHLFVKRETFDVVLDRFPWPFNLVKLPWMQEMLYVEW